MHLSPKMRSTTRTLPSIRLVFHWPHFPISPFTFPSLISSLLSIFLRDLSLPHHEAIHASYTHLFPFFFLFFTHIITFLFSALVFLLPDLLISYFHFITSFLRLDQFWAPQMSLSFCFPQTHSLWLFSNNIL
jgi:hypothetical protein